MDKVLGRLTVFFEEPFWAGVFIFAFIYYHINIRFSIKYGNLLTAVNCYIGITSSFTKVYLHRGHIS